MAITHTISYAWAGSAGGNLNGSATASASSEANASIAIPASSTNLLEDFSLPASGNRIKAVYMVCNAACTIKTNSSSSPVNTFTLAANAPLEWVYGNGSTCPFATSADVTKLYLTCSAGGQLDIRVLYDAS